MRALAWPGGVRKRRAHTSAKILIVDDHEVVRHGVRAMILRSRPEWEISGEAATGSEALQAIQSLRPDVVVLDITMPDMSGIEVALQVARLHLPAALLMFTMHESSRLLGEIRNVGAQGFVNKSCAGRDLIAAIDALLAGGTFFREGVADVAPEPGDKPNPGLSFRQQLSLRLRRA
ncbi:MAG TPA: response regulator transcription factor [Candidatus Acidoferrales bacterium]|nr:response regulator transcription factor [Candidatus Acidoferrales bacterium]